MQYQDYKTELKYGAGIGIAVCLWVLIEFLLGFHTTKLSIGEYSGYLSSIIPVLGLYFGIKEKRDKDFHGFMTYWQALKTGILMSLAAAGIIALFMYVYALWIHPEWFIIGIEYQEQKMLATGMNETEVNTQIELIKEMYNPLLELPFIFIGTWINGIFISALLSAFLKKKQNTVNVLLGKKEET